MYIYIPDTQCNVLFNVPPWPVWRWCTHPGQNESIHIVFFLWTWLGHQHLPNSEYPLFAWMQNTVQGGQHVWQLAKSSHGACKAWEKANSQANAMMALIGMPVKTNLEPGKLAYQCLGRQLRCKWEEIGTGIASGMVHLNTMNWRECAGCARPNLIHGENWAPVQIPGPRKAWTRLGGTGR